MLAQLYPLGPSFFDANVFRFEILISFLTTETSRFILTVVLLANKGFRALVVLIIYAPFKNQ